MATQGNPKTQYVQPEALYAFCGTCGRKSYNLQTLVNSGNGTLQVCGAFNSAPAKYPQAQCQGAMTLQTIDQDVLLNSQANLVNDERTTS